jgi:hypothetical protein
VKTFTCGFVFELAFGSGKWIESASSKRTTDGVEIQGRLNKHAAPTHCACDDAHFVVFCFAKPEDAEAFA